MYRYVVIFTVCTETWSLKKFFFNKKNLKLEAFLGVGIAGGGINNWEKFLAEKRRV